MKRCPECRRDYYDDSLSYCLDDGSALLEGPKSEPPASAGGQFDGEPRTAILSDSPAVAGFSRSLESDSEQKTAILAAQSAVGHEQPTAYLHTPATAGGSDRRKGSVWLLAAVGIAVLLLAGFFGYRYFNSTSKQIGSIAVMPFANDSGNADVDYLSDGMAETLMRSLSQLPGLNVKSRSSVFRYKGKDADARTIGRELGVQAVLNGRVVQRGDLLRLSLELINTDNENIVWTDTYDRKLTDLVSLQNDIARDVSDKLRLKLTNADERKLAKNYTSDPEVYRLYLQGRYYWNKRTNAEVAKAIPYFKQSIERDPNFALGYVGLADSDEDRDRPQKKAYIRRALEIDPGTCLARLPVHARLRLGVVRARAETGNRSRSKISAVVRVERRPSDDDRKIRRRACVH